MNKLVSQISGSVQTHGWTSFSLRDRMRGWRTLFSAKGLAVVLGLVLGILIAWSIANGQWHFFIGLVLLVPLLVLFNTYPFAAFMIWLLICPFLERAPTAAYRMVYWIIHRALPPLALAFAVLPDIHRASRRSYHVRIGTPEWAMIAYLSLTTLNILWFHSAPLPYVYLMYDRIFIPICLYLFVRFVAPTEKDLRYLLPIVLFLALFESVVGIMSWFAPQALAEHWLAYQGERTTGTLGYPHVYTTTLVFLALLLFQYAVHHKPGVIRWLFLLTVGACAVGVFLSFSRGSWLGGLAAAVGLYLAYPRKTTVMAAVLLVLMSLLGSGVLAPQMALARERMNSEDTAKDRLVIWNAGLRMISAKPLLGWGYESYAEHAWKFQTRVSNYVTAKGHSSHNSYIAIAAELGVPGLILFAYPVFWWLAQSVKAWRRMPFTGFWSRSMLVVLWLMILDHIVVNSFSDMRHSSYGMGLWWVILGLIGTLVEAYTRPQRGSPCRTEETAQTMGQ